MKNIKLIITFIITIIIFFIISCTQSNNNKKAESNISKVNNRSKKTLLLNKEKIVNKIKELNAVAKRLQIKAKFSTNPYDDSTLCYFRVSSSLPENIQFKPSIRVFGSSINELKKVGFNKVRIYTSKDNYKKYKLFFL